MTTFDPALYTLTPADGLETTATRMIDDAGTQVDNDAVAKYIRVIGSKLTNLEPHFWGAGMAIARYPANRKKADHYYISRALKRIEITVCKRARSEKEAVRLANFTSTAGLMDYIQNDGPTPWQSIPERFGRQRYLMYLCQEKPELLRLVGYQQSAIDACSCGGALGQPCNADGTRKMRGDTAVMFEVHHRVPLQGGGSNGIDNLCLVEKALHNPFFHKGDDPRLNKMKPDEVRQIALTVPRDDIDVIAVGLNAQEFVDSNDGKKGRQA
jgi:hypothetical protein